MSELIALDHQFFLLLNKSWTHPVLDKLMPHLTDLHKVPWVTTLVLPLILIFFLGVYKKFALKILFGLLITFALTDLISHRVIKKHVQRERPHNVAELQAELRSNKHAGYSFPSNHAANMFSLATFLAYFLPHLRLLYFSLAILIAYSRVYVGVHFPLDVIGGALLGISIGYLWARAYARMTKGIPYPPRGLRKR